MAFNVSGYNQNNGIDTASINDVAKQIFKRAQSKETTVENIDFTKFNRVSLGSDLYSGNMDSDAARQIALNKAGLQVQLNSNALNSLKYLNSEASKNIFKNVDGKVSIKTTDDIKEKQNLDTTKTTLPIFGTLVEKAEFSSDSNNSGSSGQQTSKSKKEEKDSQDDSLNILA